MERPSQTRQLTLLVIAALVVAAGAVLTQSYSYDSNYRNVSVDATVNITNSLPDVLAVTITDPISLSAGGTVYVTCNASLRDYNGGNSISNVTAVLWDNASVNFSSPDDNNNHYSNTSCTNTSVNGYYANYTCGFSIEYYANPGNGTWLCNVTVTDSYNFTNSSGSSSLYNTTTVNELLALNISTTQIDYGNLAVGDTSTAQNANVTNYGNVDINVSVKGYGQTENDGLAMVCGVGNITIANQKYSLNSTADFATQYVALSSSFAQITNLTIAQQTNDSQTETNETYWRLYVPPNPFGVCNGTVVFQAESAT